MQELKHNVLWAKIWLVLTVVLLIVGAVWDRFDQRAVTQRQQMILNQLSDISTKATARPQAHTACDTVRILQDLRSRGLDLPHYSVEERCPAP